MTKTSIHRLTFSFILPAGLLFLVFSIGLLFTETSGYAGPSATETSCADIVTSADYKQRGAHVYGVMDSTNFEYLNQNNIEWVTIIAWANQDDFDGPVVGHHNGDSAYIAKSDSSWRARIESIRAAGFKVFVKPHVWVTNPSDGKWRSDIFPANEENWKLWQNSYSDYILRYARIAEQAGAEMFCVGTELTRLTAERPHFWRNLIKEVRAVYSGQLTYAANWHKEFEQIAFWDELDFIGIQAYFPLTRNEYPTVQQLSQGWNEHLPAIEAVHKDFNRKVLFTELGYKSTATSAINPWEWIEDTSPDQDPYSPETQANCYQAFFNTVWSKEWFAGVHLWVLRSDFVKGNTKMNSNFTPQGKPAELIIAEGFE